MALDGLFLNRAHGNPLRPHRHAKINRVHQPENTTVTASAEKSHRRGNCVLLLATPYRMPEYTLRKRLTTIRNAAAFRHGVAKTHRRRTHH